MLKWFPGKLHRWVRRSDLIDLGCKHFVTLHDLFFLENLSSELDSSSVDAESA